MATQETYELTDTLGRLSAEAGDRELTLSFQQGDPYAYEHIYQRYSQRVHNVCRRMLSDPQDAQDAAQETFLRVYQALPRFNGRYHLGAWINRIATNVCLDHLRSRGRAPAEVAPNEVLDDVIPLVRDDDPEEAVLRSAEGDRVQETLSRLSPQHRTAIFMRDYEGRDYRDIAARLGVSEGRARVLLHRARQGFKKSWSSGWIFLGLPARLLQRFKRMRSPGGDQVAHAATSAVQSGHTASAPVASCTSAIAQCGDVVTERIAAVATAAIVGVSVASGAAPAILDANVLRDAMRDVTGVAATSSEIVTDAFRDETRDAPEPALSTRDESSGAREARGHASTAAPTASEATGGELAGMRPPAAQPTPASTDPVVPETTGPVVPETPAVETPAPEAPAGESIVVPAPEPVIPVEGSQPASTDPPAVDEPGAGSQGDSVGDSPPVTPSPSPSQDDVDEIVSEAVPPGDVADAVTDPAP